MVPLFLTVVLLVPLFPTVVLLVPLFPTVVLLVPLFLTVVLLVPLFPTVVLLVPLFLTVVLLVPLFPTVVLLVPLFPTVVLLVPLFPTVVLVTPVEQAPCFTNCAFVVLENTAKLKHNPMKGENCQFLCIVLTFELAKLQWSVQKFPEALDTVHRLLLDDDSMKLMHRTMDRSLILNN